MGKIKLFGCKQLIFNKVFTKKLSIMNFGIGKFIEFKVVFKYGINDFKWEELPANRNYLMLSNCCRLDITPN